MRLNLSFFNNFSSTHFSTLQGCSWQNPAWGNKALVHARSQMKDHRTLNTLHDQPPNIFADELRLRCCMYHCWLQQSIIARSEQCSTKRMFDQPPRISADKVQLRCCNLICWWLTCFPKILLLDTSDMKGQKCGAPLFNNVVIEALFCLMKIDKVFIVVIRPYFLPDQWSRGQPAC